jgi:hypothetical protein
VTAAPSRVLVSLSAEGARRLAPALGCKATHLDALAIGGVAPHFDVVTLPSRRCRSIRFVVTDVVGTAVPATQK